MKQLRVINAQKYHKQICIFEITGAVYFKEYLYKPFDNRHTCMNAKIEKYSIYFRPRK